MSDVALIIESSPPRAYYRGARPSDVDLAQRGLISMGAIRQTLRISGGDNPSATVDIDNGDGRLTAWLAGVPAYAAASIRVDDAERWRGLVSRIQLGRIARVDLVGGGAGRAYTEDLPLRTASDWPAFETNDVLPHVYGRCTVGVVRYQKEANVWLVADHACAGIDGVRQDAVAYSSYLVHQETDPTGHAVTLIETQDSSDDPGVWAVTVRGKMHQTTGELLEWPHQVLWDVLANIAGYDITLDDLDELRVAVQSAGLRCGGRVDEAGVSIQSWIDRICQGCGLAWHPDMAGIAMLWPSAPEASPWRRVTRQAAPDLAPVADSSASANICRLRYGYDWASKAYARSATLRASTAPGTAERPGNLDLGWIHAPAQALARADAWLGYWARSVWLASADLPSGTLALGQSAAVDHPYSPVEVALCVGRELGETTDRVTLQAPYGDAPEISIGDYGERGYVDLGLGAIVETQADKVAILIRDTDGTPMPAGVKVTLDGGSDQRVTDAGGRVYWSGLARGKLELLVETLDGRTLQFGITV